MSDKVLRSPFTYFGGKALAATEVWKRLGNVNNYVEPFAGSMAALLARPHWYKDSSTWVSGAKRETVNDLNCFVANFWRALQADPEKVAYYADWPVNEADLVARSNWLLQVEKYKEGRGKDAIIRTRTEPDYYNAKIAGWWVWGANIWFAGGWLNTKGTKDPGEVKKRPDLTGGCGVMRQLFRSSSHSNNKRLLLDYMYKLQDRIRYVRVVCGDWSRVTTKGPTTTQGLTGIFLDPPYTKESGRSKGLYAVDSMSVGHLVRDWCVKHGDDPQLRIALCGYEGEYKMPDDWDVWAWKTNRGYGNVAKGENTTGIDNSVRERIWFSPHCIPMTRLPLFADKQIP